jgi:uncharacterized membrane protein YfcA
VTASLLLALALSGLIGVSLGLLGGGGSILALPVLVYVAGLEVHAAVGASLAIVGATALVGGLVHARRGRADLRAAAFFGAAGMVGAPLGAQVTPLVPGRVLLLLFGTLMLVVSVLMLRGHPPARSPHPGPHPAALPLAGFGVGLLTGFLGVGGGFLIVPALLLLADVPIHRAVGSSLLVIAANSATGFVGHIRLGGLPLGMTAAFTAAAILGALVGVRVSAGLDPGHLRGAFALFVLLVGLALLARNALGG